MKKVTTYEIKKVLASFDMVTIKCPEDSYNFIKQFYGSGIEVYESFFLVLLNRAMVTEGYVKISQGGTVGTVVDVKVIALYAVKALASSVIIAHNHPSGNTKPSDADIKLTKTVSEGLSIFGIQLLDHIILTKDNYLAFSEKNLL